MKSQRCLCFALALAVGLVTPSAQEATPAFEVASVKRNVSGEPGPGGGPAATIISRPGGLFVATNTTLESLILYAYRDTASALRADQLLGGPTWLRQDRFDVNARAGADVSREQIWLMIRTLVEVRFRLVLRKEQQVRDVYTLTLARSDGRLGPDMHRASPDCKNRRGADAIAAVRSAPKPSNGAQMSFGGQCVTMDEIASGPLQRILGTTVLDRTGLTGLWDLAVAHNNQPSAIGKPDERPTLEVALQEQLGLKLERQRGPVDVFVVERVEPPSAD